MKKKQKMSNKDEEQKAENWLLEGHRKGLSSATAFLSLVKNATPAMKSYYMQMAYSVMQGVETMAESAKDPEFMSEFNKKKGDNI